MKAFRDKMVKKYGGAVSRRESVTDYEVIPTGALSLDLALRTGGWVTRRMHEIVGVEGVGKTTLAISSMIQAQRKYPDRAVCYIDMEQTWDWNWAEKLGLQTDDLHFYHQYADDSEDVADIFDAAARSGLYSMVVVDSIGGMESRQAMDKEAAAISVGRNAQVITRMVKKSAVNCRKHDVTALLINQLRANIGNPQGQDVSAGPKGFKYSTTTRTLLARAGGDDSFIKHLLPGDTDPVIIGRKIRSRVTRSKVSVEGKSGEFYIFNADTPEYGPVGIDQADEGVTIGLFTEFIDQRGAWYYFPNAAGVEVKINGRGALLTHLRSCPDDLDWVREQSIKRLAHEVIPEAEVEIETVPEDLELAEEVG
jgi:recombination protein RecA